MPEGRKVRVYPFDPEQIKEADVDSAIAATGAGPLTIVDEADLAAFIAKLDPSQSYAATTTHPQPPPTPTEPEEEEEGDEDDDEDGESD